MLSKFPLHKSIASLLLLTILVATFALTPLDRAGNIQRAQALIVHDPGNAAINRANVVVNTISKVLQDAFYIKEFTLDGIANGLAKMIIKNMTVSIVNWINSGFQGKPAFVTDLKQLLIGRLDAVAGEMIYNDPSLNFLCSPFQLDVKVALATSYQEATRGGLESAQCTLSDVTNNVQGFLNGSFSEGGWNSWFELTQNPVNTPGGAELAAKSEMYARLIDEQGRTIKELDWGDGFLSFKVCADQAKQKNCDITTPGRVIADQINKSLGAGQDALITADEINEIISALFAQLAQKVITGAGGLLGVSSPGSGGQTTTPPPCPNNGSYLADLCNTSELPATTSDPFTQAIKNENDNIALHGKIINDVNSVETNLIAAQNSSCPVAQSLQDLSPTLSRDRTDAQARIVVDNQNLVYLQQRKSEYNNASTTPERKLEIVDEIHRKMFDGSSLTTEVDNTKLDLYIDYEFATEKARVDQLIASSVRRCQDDHD